MRRNELMLGIGFICLCLLVPSLPFAMTVELTPGEIPELRLTGEIVKGDAQKVLEAMKNAETDIDGGVVIMESPGGDYLEGIMLGSVIFDQGWTTRVEKGKACLSACAYAFLGGKFYGASGGWGPSRTLETGAVLGFHPFYAKAGQQADLGDGMAAGRLATNLLYAYTSGLGIRQNIITEILKKSPEDMIIANTPRLLSGLGINLLDYPEKKSLKASEAVNLMQNMLAAKSDDWEFDSKSAEISSLDFKKDMLARLVESEQSADYPQISKQITQAIKGKPKDIDGVYQMLEALNAVPSALTGRIYKVTGLDNVHYYKSRTAYVTVHNEGSDALAIGYLLCPVDTFMGNKYCEEKSLEKQGIFYDLYEPDKALW